MATTGHEHERVEVQGLKASLKKGGNIGIYNDCICSTASATAAKVTNTVPPSFTLTAKAKILVKFTYGINVANATLQVGENAAKPIFYQGSALDAGRVKAGMFVLMQYDGTNFNILGDIAKMDEYYKDLHAGLADNLFGETQTNDKFIFRPTAGIQDIESGEPPVGGGAIRKVEGNAVAWNQLTNKSRYEATKTMGGITYTNNGDGSIGISGSVLSENYYYVDQNFHEMLSSSWGHKILVYGGDEAIQFNIWLSGIGSYHNAIIQLPSTAVPSNLAIGVAIAPNFNIKIYPKVFDLTLLFGSGNEPSTVEAFESWLSQNIGLKDYYPYNAGELIPVKDYKVKSVGFNAWDEQWKDYQENLSVGSKNPIPVLSGATYCFNIPESYCVIWYVNEDGTLFGSGEQIRESNISRYGSLSVVIPSNVHYIHFACDASTYGRIYKNDICINLSYNDDKDGTYEPYEEHQVNIDVTKVYGKLNGSGDYVQVFPDGMRGIFNDLNTIADTVDLKNGVAVSRIGKQDLGTLTWIMSYDVFATNPFPQMAKRGELRNGICDKWLTVSHASWDGGFKPNTLSVGNVDQLTFRCDHTMTGTEVSTLLSGSYLMYELATPLTYTDLVFRENGVDIPVSEIKYAVDDYGTEELLLGNDDDVVSCAPTMTIKYGINAADTIADLPHDYVSCRPQSLVDSEQRTARNNIAAASQHDMDVVKKQLELIDKKVENDYYVDMGLPSGVLWAKRNIFTGTGNDMGFAPSEYSYDADYFSWGNTDGHIPTNGTFDYSFDATTYASTDGAKLTGNIPLSQDAAREKCGEPWRMPTRNEYRELFNNCDFIDASGNIIASTTADKRTTMNSVVGFRLKSKINGMILFFPYCGYAANTTWNGKANSTNIWAADLESNSDGRNTVSNAYATTPDNYSSRYSGFVIRPVM